MELFGDIFQNLPRLNSDFLNTTWQMSRNIPTPQMLLKDVSTPSSSPKSQSPGVTRSPPLSHRSRSKSPNVSKSSCPPSQASNTSHYKSSVSSKSKSKKLSSPSLSPKSFIKRDPNIPVSATKSGKTSLYGVATARKVQMKKLPSPLPPKEPCSPIRPDQDISSKHLSDEEHSLRTGMFSLQLDQLTLKYLFTCAELSFIRQVLENIVVVGGCLPERAPNSFRGGSEIGSENILAIKAQKSLNVWNLV